MANIFEVLSLNLWWLLMSATIYSIYGFSTKGQPIDTELSVKIISDSCNAHSTLWMVIYIIKSVFDWPLVTETWNNRISKVYL